MKFTLIDDKTFDVYINNSYMEMTPKEEETENEEELYHYLKKVLINIRKKYAYDIYGFYEVDIYTIPRIATYMKFDKKEDESLFTKTIDLKIVKHDTNSIFLKFEDYFLIQNYPKIRFYQNYYYLNSAEIKEEDIIKLSEHFDIVIDDRLTDISYI